jgi:oligopeptidase B
MKSISFNKIFILLLVVTAILLSSGCNNKSEIMAPKAKKIPHELSLHGDTRIDNYYWLRERENPEVIKYLEDENKYLDAQMDDTKEFQESLYNEIIGRIKQTDISVPYKYEGYWYFTRYEEGKEYPIHCRKKGSMDATEEIMLNVNEMAVGHKYYQVAGTSVSPDNKMIAYGVDTVSRRMYILYFKNLENGEMLTDVIPQFSGAIAWGNDNKTIFYARKDEETLRPFQIFRHVLGTDPSQDKLIFEEKDETFACGVYKSKSKKYIIIGSGAKMSTEYQILDANAPLGNFKIFQPREKNLEYDVNHYGDKFYVVTNLDAKNFRLMETPLNKTTKENWKEVIPHRLDVLLEGIDIFKDYMVVSERKDGLTKLRIINWNNKTDEHYLDFGEEAYLAYTSVNPEFETEILRYGYTSLTTPNSVFDYNMKSREKTLLKQEEVMGTFKSDEYETKRLYATAADGTRIPISMVYKKGLVLNGANPMFLYGYGSYGITIDPSFSSVRLSLLDRGFVFAIAHIRGEQIYGRQWYEDGKLLKKINTFTDFNDCARYLISEKYTSPEHLYAEGGSAGGLLMGAIVNMNPELYHGVIAAVPFVDVLTTMLDESIPLTTGEYDEWGDPRIKEYYDYMKSYSPYDNVKAQAYPNMMVSTGLHDSQVQYWEPAKWVAKLRDMKTDNNLLVMYCNMETGHSGASGRFQRHKDTAREYAFLFKLEGIEK